MFASVNIMSSFRCVVDESSLKKMESSCHMKSHGEYECESKDGKKMTLTTPPDPHYTVKAATVEEATKMCNQYVEINCSSGNDALPFYCDAGKLEHNMYLAKPETSSRVHNKHEHHHERQHMERSRHKNSWDDTVKARDEARDEEEERLAHYC